MSPEQARYYTLHVKATFTSWAKQVNVDPNDVLEMAHHKVGNGGSSSQRLYNRDDTHGALRAQRAIVNALAGGWRPVTPVGRGGQTPVIEPPVALLSAPSDWSALPDPDFPFRDIPFCV